MLKCNINKKRNLVKIKAGGTGQEIVTELLCLTRDIYQHLYKENPRAALAAKNTIIGALIDPESPVWEVEDHE